MADSIVLIVEHIDELVDSRFTELKKYVDNALAYFVLDTQNYKRGSITSAKISSLNADVITVGTLSAKRLLLVGEDSVIYEINANASGLTAEQLTDEKYRSAINGSVIVAQSIKSDRIDVDEFFANTGVINKLKTSVISSIEYGGGANILLNSGFNFEITDPNRSGYEGQFWSIVNDGTSEDWTWWRVVPAGSEDWRPVEANVLEFHATNKTGVLGAQQWVKLSKNTTYTISGYVRQDRMTNKVSLNISDVVDWTSVVNETLDAPTGQGDYYSLNSFNRFSKTFNTGSHTWFRIAIWGTNWGTGDLADGVVYLAKLQLEQGETATSWAQSRDELTIGSAIYLNEDGGVFVMPKLTINVSGENGDISLDEKGLSIAIINSPSVHPRYIGVSTIYVDKSASDADVLAGTKFRSLGSAFNALSNKHITYDVEISVTAGATYYEDWVSLTGVTGSGEIRIWGNNADFPNSHLYMRGNAVQIIIDGFKITRRASSTYSIELRSCVSVQIRNCILTGTTDGDNSSGILVDNGSKALLTDNEMYGWDWAWIAAGASYVNIVNCKGNCRGLTIESISTTSGYQPCDNSTTFAADSWYGSLLNNSATVNQGSATPDIPPIPTTATTTFSATTSHTVYGSTEWPGSWKSETTEVWQGYTTTLKYQAAMFWFSGISALYGKTILSAKLRIRRVPGTGKGDDVNLVGYYGDRTYNNGSGSPNPRWSMGTLGTIGNDGDMHEFTIPVAAITHLAEYPTTSCLAFNPSDSSVMSGKSYSSNYAKFSGVGSGYTPELVVTYQP